MQAAKKTTTVREALRTKAAFDTPVQVTADKEAIAKGHTPLPSRRPDVAAIRAKVMELYGLITGRPILAIDSSFKFSPQELDSAFNYLQVEALLEQASVLLEACRSHKQHWDQLQAEKWKLALELDQFFRLLEVEEREREAGADTLGYERAVLEGAAEQSLQENHKQAEAQRQALLDSLVNSGLNRRMAAREVSAWLSAYPLKDADLRGDDAAYTFDGVRKSKPEHLFEAAHKEADEDAWEQVHSLAADISTAVAASEAARLRAESLALQAKLLHSGISASRDRAQIARDTLWEKAFQAQVPGGLFHYQEQTTLLQLRFSADLRDAVACLTAAARGLKELYDFAPPFPQDGQAGYFSSVLGWVSSARTRLAQMSRLDQNYTLAVSLKDLAKASWEAGLARSEWTFNMPEELFAGQSFVRLRGIGISVVGANADAAAAEQKTQKSREPAPAKATGFWSGRVSLPPKATLQSSAGTRKDLDQKLLPVCNLGRVAEREAREAEVAGIDVLRNASPIGSPWKLSLSAKSTSGTPTASLQDIEIYLHLAVRS